MCTGRKPNCVYPRVQARCFTTELSQFNALQAAEITKHYKLKDKINRIVHTNGQFQSYEISKILYMPKVFFFNLQSRRQWSKGECVNLMFYTFLATELDT